MKNLVKLAGKARAASKARSTIRKTQKAGTLVSKLGKIASKSFRTASQKKAVRKLTK